MKDPSQHISQTLKERRNTLGWSLDKTSKETKVSKAMLGQIERGESSPTITTLWRIATGTGLSLSAFLVDPDPTLDGPVLRTADEIRQHQDDEGFSAAILFPYEPRYGFEFFELTFAPDYERISIPHEQGVVEHITVIEGEMEILSRGEWIKIAKGQTLRFPADEEHGYRNSSPTPCRAHNIIHYPGQSQLNNLPTDLS